MLEFGWLLDGVCCVLCDVVFVVASFVVIRFMLLGWCVDCCSCDSSWVC